MPGRQLLQWGAARPTAPAAFRLTRYFSLTSVFGVILVTACLIWVYQHITVRLMVAHESRANADLTRAFANAVWKDYREFVIGSTGRSRESLLADPAIAGLRADILGKMGGLRVAKVKVYNLAGMTVFSTDERQIGESKATNEGFRRARDGAGKGPRSARPRPASPGRRSTGSGSIRRRSASAAHIRHSGLR